MISKRFSDLLTLTLRKNSARERYWLWLPASQKFLVAPARHEAVPLRKRRSAQIKALLGHEVEHVRRRINLARILRLLAQVLWFQLLEWWLGRRLAKGTERACDEGAIRLVKERQVYAESLFTTFEFRPESPLAYTSEIGGADLKKRIVCITTQRVEEKLDLNRKLLLRVVAVTAIALATVFGLLQATQSWAESFSQSTGDQVLVHEVASIKPNKSGDNRIKMMYTPDGLSATNGSVQMLIGAAYGVDNNQISGAPNWVSSERYDIEAKMDNSTVEQLCKQSEDERRVKRSQMLQALLAERFKLTINRESKELPEYALVVTKDGPKFKAANPGDTYPNGLQGPDGKGGADTMMVGRGTLTGQGVEVVNLVRFLRRQLRRTVVDRTGLADRYDFTLKWSEERQPPMVRGAESQPDGSGPPSETSEPSIFTALQEQLGLKLESQKGPVEIVVIDHVEKPSEE